MVGPPPTWRPKERRQREYRAGEYDHYGRQSFRDERDAYRNNYEDAYYSQPTGRTVPPRDPKEFKPYDYNERHVVQYDDYDGQYNARPDGYTFRGAAKDHREPSRPQEDFNFRSNGPSAPLFPPVNAPDRSHGSGPRSARPRDYKAGSSSQRGSNNYRGNNPRPPFKKWQPKPAHERDLLNKTHRASTPEQLEGMNDNAKPRFKDLGLLDSESDRDDAPRAKRVKVDAEAPKWSNPDPYTALPPTDAASASKKDIVQVIRKAKLEAAKDSGKSAIDRNVDFISFDLNDNTEDIASPAKSASYMGLESQHERSPANYGSNGAIVDNKKKRKRPYEGRVAGVLDEWQPHRVRDPTPWFKPDAPISSNIGLRLHAEVLDFYDFVRPQRSEEEVRLDLIDRITSAIRFWSGTDDHIDVHAFGSFASGLYLPVADMDLVAISREFSHSGMGTFCRDNAKMRALGRHLVHSNIARPETVVGIFNARVPLLKFVDRETGIKVDLSFENFSGLQAIATCIEWKHEYPAMAPIVVLIKQLLAMYGYNEVHTGGIGGFTIICLVVSMLQLMPEQQKSDSSVDQHYGDLLMNFLELYGSRFDYRTTGILMDPPRYYDKGELELVKANFDRLTIVDPNNKNNDISGGSRNIVDILDTFQIVHDILQQRITEVYKGNHVDESILGCCWAADYTTFQSQRAALSLCHEGLDHEPNPALRLPDLKNLPQPVDWKRKKKVPRGKRFH